MKLTLVALLAACAATRTATAQAPLPPAPDAAWDSAAVAWDEGRYPDALRRIERLLTGARAEDYLERAALLTGELYQTTGVAPDGRAVRWSPGGRYIAIEIGLGNARHTAVLRFENGAFTRVADLAGYGLAFAFGDGFAAFITPEGVRDIALADGAQRVIPTGSLRVRAIAYGPDGTVFAAAGTASDTTSQLYALGPATPRALTVGAGGKAIVAVTGNRVVYTLNRDRFGSVAADLVPAQPTVAADPVSALGGGPLTGFTGALLSVHSSGRVAYVVRDGADYELRVVTPGSGDARRVVRRPYQLTSPAWSPDGRRIAFQAMPREDWELYVVGDSGQGERRLTREVQHDLFPVFLNDSLLLEKIGEGRHRRSYLIDVTSDTRTRLFHNNTVRTVAPEYAWAPSPDGTKILIVADRDGNTISPERGVYLLDLARKVSVADVLARVRTSLAAEETLRANAHRMYAPIRTAVRAAVNDVSVARIDRYAHALYSFDTKFIGHPGNRRAIEYLVQQLRSFGYEPVVQEFEPRPGVPSANVVATLRGTVDPDLTYVVSSHFDSVEPGPGADDDASGATQMLEAARVLAHRPQRATIQFAFYTAEEAGLLGAREFARRARADSLHVLGALNNDMIGWRNDHRFDNTIRYSNDGLRDLQHAAALEFTSLITYDSRYYQSTDAQALFDVYGDIIAGIGSYPILGNPHYHQSHDVLETIDQRLVAEVSKTTVASLMLMASSPSRVKGLVVRRENGRVVVAWDRLPEHDIVRYAVRYGPDGAMDTHHGVLLNPRFGITTTGTRAVLDDLPEGTRIEVRAVMRNGTESWDSARATVPAR